MDRASHSVAAVLLVMTMTVGTSHCMMSNKTNGGAGFNTTVTTTTAGNSSIGAALAWCEGYIIDGQCDLIIPEAYGGDGERLEHSNQMDMMLQLVEYAYGSSGESYRRVLVSGGLHLGDRAKNGNSQACTNSKDQAYLPNCHDKPGTGPKPGCPNNAPPTRRDCYKGSHGRI